MIELLLQSIEQFSRRNSHHLLVVCPHVYFLAPKKLIFPIDFLFEGVQKIMIEAQQLGVHIDSKSLLELAHFFILGGLVIAFDVDHNIFGGNAHRFQELGDLFLPYSIGFGCFGRRGVSKLSDELREFESKVD